MSADTVDVKLDREQAWLIYCTFAGDCARTAAALNIRAVDVLKMSEEEGWLEKMKPILELKKSGKPQDYERALNRCLNFVIAHRFRLFCERIMNKLMLMGDEEVEDYIFTKASAKDGTPIRALSTRALADLASALEKATAMSYAALADSSAERVKRKEDGGEDGASAGDLHTRIAAAMASVRASSTPRAQLFDAQVEIGQTLVKEISKPSNPNDSDEH